MNAMLVRWSRHNLEEWKKEQESFKKYDKKLTRKEKIKQKFIMQEKARKNK
tara:strand:- start:220 stop:372 length:153 start_codon:yes stop_codon:yes gene_type:complete